MASFVFLGIARARDGISLGNGDARHAALGQYDNGQDFGEFGSPDFPTLMNETELTPLPVADPGAEVQPLLIAAQRAPFAAQLVTFVAIVVPFLGLIAVPFLWWGRGFSWVDFGLLVGMYTLTVLGITVGYHRLFTHRSFETYSFIKIIFCVLGSMAVQGPMLKWVAMHRRHHQHSDTELDPHSPHHHGSGVLGMLKGAWHAHVGWCFQRDPENLERYIVDLEKNKPLRITSALFVLWTFIGLAIPAALGGIITGTWTGVLTGLIWGGLVRTFLVHHVTWSINSACHLWGLQLYPGTDHSRDNIVFGFLGLGEGWHGSHHAFPTSARHGLRWWQIDVSYYVIRTLALIRLAWDVKLPADTKVAPS